MFPVSGLQAQNIDLAAGGADQIWHGAQAGSHAAKWFDQGPINAGDTRRDIVIGAPGNGSLSGKVYVIFAGPVPSGDLSLTSANVVVSGSSAGDGFGTSTAIGPITVNGSSGTHNLVVGAPGALGGRGAVYVFPTPLASGSYTTASASYVVVGAPGDRLGDAISTADINNDGYRELVMGAPGNSRVYVVAGNPTLAGTRDLAVTGADLLINGTGIGSSIQAGDVTGDGIYEILIGSVAQNAVYLLTGGYPAVSTLPANADAVFSGIDAGDATGIAMRLADLDADGRRDIIIGAPGGDGPGNSRHNTGEVYVLWGRASYASMSLASADVTFYGAVAEYQMGQQLAAGDINRDTPNDVVFLAPGAGSAGELHVYYGRSRTQFGAVLGDGRHVVDFATLTSSRRIIGNPASGAIVSSIVFEVTGEGARDIIVGVPSDSSDRGAAFFAMSPKMTPSPGSITVTLEQGATTNRGIVIENPSSIPVTWSATTNRTWLSVSPGSGSSVVGAYGSVTLYASASGLAVGTYTGSLTVASTTGHLVMSRVVTVQLTVTGVIEPPPPPPPPPTPVPPDTSNDFSGDGRMDLLFRNVSTGDVVMWAMDGSRRLSATMLNPYHVGVNWRLAGTGNFNADGKPDILWQEETTGDLFVWFMDGTSRTGYSYLSIPHPADTAWKVISVADMNGDLKADLIWQNAQNGYLALWIMDGVTVTSRLSMNPYVVLDADWHVVNTADFNRDGKTDLLWKHSKSGYMIVWIMDGANRTDVRWLNPYQLADVRWDIVAAGDLNGDGHSDIVFQHPDGRLVAWFMDGITRTSALMLMPDHVNDVNWRVAAPR